MTTADVLDLRIAEEGLEQVVTGVLSRLGQLTEGERLELVTALEEACGVKHGLDEQKWRTWLHELAQQGVTAFGPVSSTGRSSLPANGEMVATMVEEIAGGADTIADEGGGLEGNAPPEDLNTDPLLKEVPVHQGYKVLGGVVIYQKLGQGGMGAVYRGRHLRLDIDVALKVMAPPAGMQRAEVQNFIKRFVREAKTAASINHTSLVRVIDVNSEGGVYYLVMDYIDGESAGERLKRKTKLTEVEAVEVALGSAEGLGEAHSEGIVHRDVKPDNIMIDKKGRVRVTDLGLAKAYSGQGDSQDPSMLTQSQSAMGTPCYMSPEQFMSARDVGPQADVWSLGVTLYHLLSGELPYSDTSVYAIALKVTQEPFPDLKSRCPELSDAVCEIVNKAVAKDPANRYPDCKQMASALRRHLYTIRMSDISVLPDEAAGSAKFALATMTPPNSRTLTLIGDVHALETLPQERAPVRRDPDQTLETRAPGIDAAPRSSRAPLYAVLAVLVLAGIGAAIWFTQKERGPAAASSSSPAATTPDRATEAKPKADDLLARQKRFAELLEAGNKAESLEDFTGAMKLLQEAAPLASDDAMRERIVARVGQLDARRLIAEARTLEDQKKLADAAVVYERALTIAIGELKQQVSDRLQKVRARIALAERIAAVKREVDAERWREAWDLIETSRSEKMADPQLDAMARQAIDALAPKRTVDGPLGIAFVLVPCGRFTMGSDDGEKDERPAHEVTVSAYYVGRTEITKAQYDAFQKGLTAAPETTSAEAREPAVEVAWHDAMAFCRHLNEIDQSRARYRLPTEAEWELAARGTESTVYPWGATPPGAKHANLEGSADGYAALAPVGSFPNGASALGVLDLVGNAAEWCADWYGPYAAKPQTNPSGPDVGQKRVVRGSAYAYDAATWSLASMRAYSAPTERVDTIGFRVVRELTAEEAKFLALVEGGRE